MKKADQRYSRVGNDDNDNDNAVTHKRTNSNSSGYHNDPDSNSMNDDSSSRSNHRVPLQRLHSAPMSVTKRSSSACHDHPLQQPQPQPPCNNTTMEMQDGSNGSYNNNNNTLRMRGTKSPLGGIRPINTISSSIIHMSKPQEENHDNVNRIVVLEGMGHVDMVHANTTAKGSVQSGTRPPPRQPALTKKINDNDDEEQQLHDGSDHGGGGGGGGGGASRSSSRGEGEGDNDLFCASHGSSFDFLDDEDEINLQRYHRDYFGATAASAAATPYHDNDNDHDMDLEPWEDDANSTYHPRSDSNGSHSKNPWIRMVRQQQQPHHNHYPSSSSPTNAGSGTMPLLSSIHSLDDLLLYLQGILRQARQRRAQRLLTMPSEQWWERLQFCFMTYCWDATDVGLLLVAILLVVWLTGLLWLPHSEAETEYHDGNNNNNPAELDPYDYETATHHGRSWRILFQWWWWGLGCVLLVRILGPLAVQNINNRRRARRRQRFMSGTMGGDDQHQQQPPSRIMHHPHHHHQQQPQPVPIPIPTTMVASLSNSNLSGTNDLAAAPSRDIPIPLVVLEITETKDTTNPSSGAFTL